MNSGIRDVVGNALFVVNHNNVLAENSRESFKAASKRWDCAYVECTGHSSKYSPRIVKLKAFDICPYERIMVLDADTIIREDTPNIFELTDPNMFYAVKNNQESATEETTTNNSRIAKINIERILEKKIVKTPVNVRFISENFFNSGLFVIHRDHEEVLALAFYLFLNVHQDYWRDMIPLNLAVFSVLGKYRGLEPTFNRQFPVDSNKMTDYIYHPAGQDDKYKLLEKVNWRV